MTISVRRKNDVHNLKKKIWIKTAWAMHAVIPCRHEVCIFGIQCNSVKQKNQNAFENGAFFSSLFQKCVTSPRLTTFGFLCETVGE